ncbi:MAG: hypothetical protein LC650_01295 [Actinobacteria bacterium]|nr:hypothetical protein [Actinomycetota bacterium]
MILPPSIWGRPSAFNVKLALDPLTDTDALRSLVRIEPIFFLRAIAMQRGISLDRDGGLNTLLGGAATYVASHPQCLSTLRSETARFQLGPERILQVPLRSAYVAMLQRYGLPTAIISDSAAGEQQQQRSEHMPAEAQHFINTFLGGLPLSRDMMRLGDRGEWRDGIRNGEQSQVNTAAPLHADSYYDVHPTHSADGELLSSGSGAVSHGIPAKDMPAAAFITMLSETLAGDHAKAECFYPFCIWLVCDPLSSHSAPAHLPHGKNHHNARFH